LDDVPRVAELARASGLAFDPAEELQRAWARLWVVDLSARLSVGALLAWHVADELQILDVATLPELRRRGIGRALLEHALAYARRHAVRLVLLEVRRSNGAALGLYLTSGFVLTNERQGYYSDGEDALELALSLETP
jgi:ribosomal-protein-alanine N-acetyltransferase